MDEEWIIKYADRLYSYARARLSDMDEIQDVIQDTLLAAMHSKDTFRGESQMYTWVIGILKHKIHDVYRAKARKNKFFSDHPEWNNESNNSQANQNRTNNVADTRPDPGGQTESNFMRDELFDCIDQLPDIYKQALRLRELDDIGTSEICNILSITPTNLNVILYRARVKLKKCLEGKGIHSVE
jgi:RNA polymerase sigma-70 factor (ECF subfamily)